MLKTGMLLLTSIMTCGLAACGDGNGSEDDADADAAPDPAGDQDAEPQPDADADPAQDQDVPDDAAADPDLDIEIDPGPACGTLLVEPADSASVIPPPGGPVPDAGVPFTIAQTGIEVTRISDVDDSGAVGSFYTNGYSRWSAASITGEYVTAFSSNGGASVYRLSDRSIVYTLDVGEPNELHWDASGAAGTETTVYYREGAQLRRVDILSGEDSLVHDFTAEYPSAGAVLNGVEGAPSNDMRYWAFQICEGMTGGGQCTGLMDIVVYDKSADAMAGRLSDVESGIPTPNFVDMAPSGSRIVVGSCKESGSTPAPWNGPYAWSLDFSSNVRLGTNCTHSGWAWGTGGEELYVSFDSCGASNEEITDTCDHIMAVDVNDPSGWENRIPVIYAGDIGWGTGTHMGRIYMPHVRGWFFLSTYGGSSDGWASDQLMFIEIKHVDDGPRLWRVTPTLNEYTDYWSEAFASVDFHGMNVYWGANWSGADNLELYQARLCDRWWEEL
jgi:hypothetical protein